MKMQLPEVGSFGESNKNPKCSCSGDCRAMASGRSILLNLRVIVYLSRFHPSITIKPEMGSLLATILTEAYL
jgi:hypothetical protein